MKGALPGDSVWASLNYSPSPNSCPAYPLLNSWFSADRSGNSLAWRSGSCLVRSLHQEGDAHLDNGGAQRRLRNKLHRPLHLLRFSHNCSDQSRNGSRSWKDNNLFRSEHRVTGKPNFLRSTDNCTDSELVLLRYNVGTFIQYIYNGLRHRRLVCPVQYQLRLCLCANWV